MMRSRRVLLLAVCALLGAVAAAVAAGAGDKVAGVEGEHQPSFLDFSVEDLGGNEVPLSAFAQYPVILVVNVASACGYTEQNYRELQALYEKHHDDGFTVLAFPCNQFARQEPGTPSEILQFVQETYHVTFPVFSKVRASLLALASDSASRPEPGRRQRQRIANDKCTGRTGGRERRGRAPAVQVPHVGAPGVPHERHQVELLQVPGRRPRAVQALRHIHVPVRDRERHRRGARGLQAHHRRCGCGCGQAPLRRPVDDVRRLCPESCAAYSTF